MKRTLILSLIIATFLSCTNSKKDSDVVNVYTKRHYQVVKDLFESFEKDLPAQFNFTFIRSVAWFIFKINIGELVST